MRRAWIGNAFLAASWLLGLSYFHEAETAAWVCAVFLGTSCLTRLRPALPSRMIGLVSGGLLLPAVWIAPWPHKMPLVLIAVGSFGSAFRTGAAWLQRLGSAALVAGAVLLAQSMSILAYRHLTARFVDLPEGLTGLIAALATLCGMEATADGSRLVLYSMRETHSLSATWTMLADPVSVVFLTGGLLLLALDHVSRSGRRTLWPRVALLCGTVILWLPFRLTLLLAVFLHRALRTDYGSDLDLIGQFWSPWAHSALLLVPLAVMWRWDATPKHSMTLDSARAPATALDGDDRVSGNEDEADTGGNPPSQSVASRPSGLTRWLRTPSLRRSGLIGLGALLVTVAFFWQPVGQRRAGRVLVDDFHSGQPWPMKEYDTTRTDRPFDTEWYGRESSYNYACIYDYCSRLYRMSRQTQPLTDAALSQCDVVVLKDPSAPFSPEERGAIRRFLERGGGVLLLGDHTSVFGSGVNLNGLTQEWGFRYRYDCAFGIDSAFDQTYVPPLVPHPIVQHVRTMEFATSCTLEVETAWGRAPILCSGLKSLEADYHSSNFYPQPRNRPEMRWGAFVQLWATRAGPGRIAAFTDSTIFSNFCVFEPGKRELFVGLIEWLNHGNAWRGWTGLLGVSGLTAILGGIAVGRGRPLKRLPLGGRLGGALSGRDVRRAASPESGAAGAWLLAAAAGVAGWWLGVEAVRAAHQRSMPFPQPVRPLVMVSIDRTVSSARLPKNGFIAGGAAGSATRYQTEFGQLERAILRLGYFYQRAGGEDATQADLVIVPFPSEEDQNVVREYGERLEEFVRGGGKLLILDGPENASSRANSLLYRFGMGVRRVDTTGRTSSSSKRPLVVREPWASPPVTSSLEVTGGTPLAWFNGRTAAAWMSHGQGIICVVGFGARFRDDQMGPAADTEPQGEFKDVYGLLYAVVSSIARAQMPAEGPIPPTAAEAPSRAIVTPMRPLPASSPSRSQSSSNLAFPPGWSTNPFVRAKLQTNAAYRAWFSNYISRVGGTTNVPRPDVSPGNGRSNTAPAITTDTPPIDAGPSRIQRPE